MRGNSGPEGPSFGSIEVEVVQRAVSGWQSQGTHHLMNRTDEGPVVYIPAFQGYTLLARTFLEERVDSEREQEHASRIGSLGAVAALESVGAISRKNEVGRGAAINHVDEAGEGRCTSRE